MNSSRRKFLRKAVLGAAGLGLDDYAGTTATKNLVEKAGGQA
jgi:hypothetical protein